MKKQILTLVVLSIVFFTGCEKTEIEPTDTPEKKEAFAVDPLKPKERNGKIMYRQGDLTHDRKSFFFKLEIDYILLTWRQRYNITHSGSNVSLTISPIFIKLTKGDKVTISNSKTDISLYIDSDLNLKTGNILGHTGYEYVLQFPANQTTSHIIE
jgi:hypothetical protein